MHNTLIEVGWDKNGEMDFGVHMTVLDLSYEQMNQLRQMVVVAIGEMESIWKDEQSRKLQSNQKIS